MLIHHLPGWSEFYIETTRQFAHHGYMAICANLYERSGAGNPDDIAAKVRAEGGVPDAQMVGDTAAAVKWMRAQPGQRQGRPVRLLLGRPARLPLCVPEEGCRRLRELWGGRVVMGKEELNAKTPVAPIDLTRDLSCPLSASSATTIARRAPSR